jgi:hypothetical protein
MLIIIIVISVNLSFNVTQVFLKNETFVVTVPLQPAFGLTIFKSPLSNKRLFFTGLASKGCYSL